MKDMKTYYLDYAASAPMSEYALQEMQPYFRELFANPSSVHEAGQKVRMAVDKAREKLASFIGADFREIYFTSGGTESINLAIHMGAMLRKDRGNHLITTRMEHPAVLETFRALQEKGFEINLLPVDTYGRVSCSDLEKAITKNTILISVMTANHEVGSIQPISQICRMAKEKDIFVHTDAVAAFGQIPINVKDTGVDLMSVSAHKIGGPKGIGLLYVKKGIECKPMIYGGGQERGLRSGTENVPAIMGFCAAAKEKFCKDNEAFAKQIRKIEDLREYMTKKLLTAIPNCTLSGDSINRLPGNIHLRFEGIEAHQLVLDLSKHGVYVSAGSACHSNDPKPSHVLRAMGFSHREAYSGLRLSFGNNLTKEDVDEIVKRMEKVCRTR